MPYTIAVLIKQVPDMNAIKIDRVTGKPVLSGQNAISSYDECALEAAIQIKETHGGEVIVLSAGPASVKDAVNRALAMGADRGIIVPVDQPDSLDALDLAHALADQVRALGPDLLFAGQTSDDFASGQIGPMVAELLGMPQIGSIASYALDDRTLTVERDTEDGRQQLEVTLPAMLLAQVGLNEPRYPSLKGIMAAKKKPVETVAAPSPHLPRRLTWGEPYLQARPTQGTIVQDVAPADAAAQLVTWLREHKLV